MLCIIVGISGLGLSMALGNCRVEPNTNYVNTRLRRLFILLSKVSKPINTILGQYFLCKSKKS